MLFWGKLQRVFQQVRLYQKLILLVYSEHRILQQILDLHQHPLYPQRLCRRNLDLFSL